MKLIKSNLEWNSLTVSILKSNRIVLVTLVIDIFIITMIVILNYLNFTWVRIRAVLVIVARSNKTFPFNWR